MVFFHSAIMSTRTSETSPYARRAKIVFLVVGLEGPGETRKYWEALLMIKR
jgi:hypothetical protein